MCNWAPKACPGLLAAGASMTAPLICNSRLGLGAAPVRQYTAAARKWGVSFVGVLLIEAALVWGLYWGP